jgi:hypothetical protein
MPCTRFVVVTLCHSMCSPAGFQTWDAFHVHMYVCAYDALALTHLASLVQLEKSEKEKDPTITALWSEVQQLSKVTRGQRVLGRWHTFQSRLWDVE